MSRDTNSANDHSFMNMALSAAGVVAVAFIVSLITFELSGGGATQSEPKVVILDHSQLLERKFKQLMNDPNLEGLSEEEAKAQGNKAARDLAMALNQYAEAGYVLLSADSVVYAPDQLDVTEEIASKLGIPPLPDNERAAGNVSAGGEVSPGD